MSGRRSTRKMLRCARLDDSDEQVFAPAAAAGEWAIPGSFEFLDDDAASLTGQRGQAFRSGFIGLNSFGWCTLVCIATIDESQYEEALDQLAGHLFEHFGAPDRAAARHAARSELAYAESLCEYDLGTLVAVQRELTADRIEESFKRFIPEHSADWEQARPLSLSDLVKQEDL